jgi:hypothetical protein
MSYLKKGKPAMLSDLRFGSQLLFEEILGRIANASKNLLVL